MSEYQYYEFQALSTLEDLRDLAQLKGKLSDFKSRIRALQRTH